MKGHDLSVGCLASSCCLALSPSHPSPNLFELVHSEARQPERSRFTLNKRADQAFKSEMRS